MFDFIGEPLQRFSHAELVLFLDAREQARVGGSQVPIIFRPAGRFFTNPFPPGVFAAFLTAAAIRVPRVFFAIILFPFLFSKFVPPAPYGVGRVIEL